MELVCLDLMGTLLDHRSGEGLPSMARFLQVLQKEVAVHVVSRFSVAHTRKLLDQAGLLRLGKTDLPCHHAKDTAARVRCFEKLLAEPGVSSGTWVDNKPENLWALHAALGRKVRMVGFTGSGQYPDLGPVCAALDARFGLSTWDLGAILGLDLRHSFASAERLTVAQLVPLVPGLLHPMSAFGGSDRHVVCILMDRMGQVVREGLLPQLWRHLAWIGCNECLTKIMLELAAHQTGQRLGDPYYAEAYARVYLAKPAAHRDQLTEALVQGMAWMEEGVALFGGRVVEEHRASWQPQFEVDRLDKVRRRLQL